MLFRPKKSIWQTSDEVLIINGYVYKKDSNLVTTFKIDEIPDLNTIVGPYPQSEDDIKTLAEKGVTAVLCVQSYADFLHREIDYDKVKHLIESYDMKSVHIPILDFSEEDLKKHILDAVK